MAVFPVSVCVIAFLSLGRTPLLRVSTPIISTVGEPGVVKARDVDLLVDVGL